MKVKKIFILLIFVFLTVVFCVAMEVRQSNFAPPLKDILESEQIKNNIVDLGLQRVNLGYTTIPYDNETIKQQILIQGENYTEKHMFLIGLILKTINYEFEDDYNNLAMIEILKKIIDDKKICAKIDSFVKIILEEFLEKY